MEASTQDVVLTVLGAGFGNELWRRDPSTGVWSLALLGADDEEFMAVAIRDNVAYLVARQGPWSDRRNRVYESTDAGVSWTMVVDQPAGQQDWWVVDALVAFDQSALYIADHYFGLWLLRGGSLEGPYPFYSRDPPLMDVAALSLRKEGGLYVGGIDTGDPTQWPIRGFIGDTFFDLTAQTSPHPVDGDYVYSVADSEAAVFFVDHDAGRSHPGQNLYRSTDGGASWATVNPPGEDYVAIVGTAPPSPGPAVVVLPGWRSDCDDGVQALTQNLKEQFGDQWVDCYEYFSEDGVAWPAARLAPFVRQFRQRLALSPEDEVHLVGHSMGGLVARHYYEAYYDAVDGPIGSINMLGAPNEGAWLAGIEKALCSLRVPGFPLVPSALCGVVNLPELVSGIDLDSQAVKDMTPGSDVLRRLNDEFVLPPSPVYQVHAGWNGSKLGRITHPGEPGDCLVTVDSAYGRDNVFGETALDYDGLSHDRFERLGINWCDDDTLVNSPDVVLDLVGTIRGISGSGGEAGEGSGAAAESGGPGAEGPLAASVFDFVLPGQQKMHQITAPAGLTGGAFAVLWLDAELEPNLGFTLRRPDGTVVGPSDPDVIDEVTITGDGMFFVLMRGFAMSAPQPGGWQVTVEGLSVPEEGQPYLVALMPDSQVVLSLDTTDARLSEGAPQVVMATLFDGASPIEASSISAQVQTPAGTEEELVLRDDGTGGDETPGDLIYSGTFTNTTDCGGYRILGTATGDSTEGTATRQQMGIFEVYVAGDAVRNPCEPDEDDDLLTDVDEVEIYLTNPLDTDTDDDGCAESEELPGAPAPKPGSTGPYDPLAWYDFYDVPVPAYPDPTPNGTRNKAIAMDDVLAVLFYTGTSPTGACGDNPNANGVDYDCDKDGDTVPDGRDYDRTPGPEPNPPWDAGPPNGAVAMDDVLAVLAQTGLDCSGPPPSGGGGSAGASAGGARTSSPAPNAMAVDAVSGGGVNPWRTVMGEEPFDIDAVVMLAEQPSAGYNLVLAYNDQLLEFIPIEDLNLDTVAKSWTYTGLGGMNLDATVVVFDLDGDTLPDRAVGGSARGSGTTSATGAVVTARFRCIGNGGSYVHLVSPSESATGTTTLAVGGGAIETSLADGYVYCWGVE